MTARVGLGVSLALVFVAGCGSDETESHSHAQGCFELSDGRCVEETFHNPPVLEPNADGVYERGPAQVGHRPGRNAPRGPRLVCSSIALDKPEPEGIDGPLIPILPDVVGRLQSFRVLVPERIERIPKVRQLFTEVRTLSEALGLAGKPG